MKHNSLKNFVIAGIVLVVLGGVMTYSQRAHEYRSDEFLMDTLVSIRVYGSNTDLMKKAVNEAFSEMRRIHELTDRFAPPDSAAFQDSDVCQINAAAGIKPVLVNNDVFIMLAIAKEYNEITNGAFDITIGPVIDVWGFGQPEQKVPSIQELKEALAHVSSNNLILDREKQTAFLTKAGMSLDLGAVAKGYATERAASTLVKYGIKEALIDAGGNIRAIGKKDGKSPWNVGVQDPRDSTNLVAILSLDDEAAVTSGDYNRFFTYEGNRYHHLISPRTGMPARENTSVTVIAKDAVLGDVLSTSLFVLDSDQALEVIRKIEGTDVLIVTSKGRIITSPDIQNKIKIMPGEVYSYDQR